MSDAEKETRGTPGAEPESHDIDLTSEGIWIDGQILAELTVGALVEALGEPRVVPPESRGATSGGSARTLFIWDRSGVFVWADDQQSVIGLEIRLARDIEWESRVTFDFEQQRPREVFSGRFTVMGQEGIEALPEKALRKAYIFLDAKAGDWQAKFSLTVATQQPIGDMTNLERLAATDTPLIADIVRNAEVPFRDVSISYAPPKPVKKSSGKWKIAAPVEPVVEFAKLPFKYAIVNELMYALELLEPKFDVRDFAADQGARSFDPDELGYDTIPMVRNWFRKLPVPTRLAEQVTELTTDGGNDIYLQLAPRWDGEDGQFDIRSITDADLAPFPNLRSVHDIGGFFSKSALRVLERNGIEVH